MHYFRQLFLALVTATFCVSVLPAYGQNSEAETDPDVSAEQDTEEAQESQANDGDEDSFTPTETIKVDSAISFPVDI